MFTKRRPGFTLIELLVVLAVLAALAAILFPVFASARHRARMTACASNLHQISLALHQYAAENDGSYPPDDPLLAHNPHLVWTLLTPYTHTLDVFHCPDALGPISKSRGYFYVYGSLPYAYSKEIIKEITRKAPRPGSGTVVAFCDEHTRRSGPDGWALDAQGHEIGPLIVVREDGSTSQIQADRVERWVCHNGQWAPLPYGLPQVGDLMRSRFPGEEWPPQD